MSVQIPQKLLICCEGKETEKHYFSILRDTFRISGVEISIIPKMGQDYALIDRCVEKRNFIAQNNEIDPQEIETWAVCDRDSFKDSYSKLKKYADGKKVRLAFSDPQFENFLMQHFGSPHPSKEKGAVIEQELSTVLGFPYNKSDLDWFRTMIDRKPKIIHEIIEHANVYDNHTKQPFFTVQNLVKRLLELNKYF